MRATLLRTRLLGAIGLPLAAGCSSPPAAGPSAPPPGPTTPRDPAAAPGHWSEPSAPARVRTATTDEQGVFAGLTPPLTSAWYVTYRPSGCAPGMLATEQTLACQPAAQVAPGDGTCSDPGSCPTADAEALGCPLTVGRGDTHRFFEPIGTRLERATRATACCYGPAPVCQFRAVPGRPLVVGGRRVVARLARPSRPAPAAPEEAGRGYRKARCTIEKSSSSVLVEARWATK